MTTPRLSVLAGVLRPLPVLAARLRADHRPWLHAAGIAERELTAAGARLSLHAVASLLSHAARTTGREDFGLQLGLLHQPQDLGALGYLWLAAADIGTAISAGAAYESFVQGGQSFSLHSHPRGIWVGYDAAGLPSPLRRQDSEFTLIILLTALRRLTGRSLAPLAVSFSQSPPPDPRPHARAFGRKPSFLARQTGLLLPAEAAALPIPTRDDALFAILRTYLEAQMDPAETPPAFAQRLAGAIRRHLPQGAKLARLASDLGYSPRSLQRRITQAGLNLRQEITKARRERGETLLRSGAPIATLADALGFADAAAASRFWRQTTGSPPRRHAGRT